jgi:hypothetical protein
MPLTSGLPVGPGRADARKRHVGDEKEAAPAGGESGGRAHGPALGGEAGSVLIWKLIRIEARNRPLGPRIVHWALVSTARARMQRQRNELEHIRRAAEQCYPKIKKQP